MRFAFPYAPPRPRALQFAALAVFAFMLPLHAFAQAGQTSDTATGASPLAKYDATSIDNVNFENGNVFLRLPLVGFPQRGHVLRLNFNIYYNDKQWYLSQLKQDPTTYNYSGQWTYIPASTTPDVPTAAVGAYVARDQHLTFGIDTFTSVRTDNPEPYAYCSITTTTINSWVRTPDNSQHQYGDSQNQDAQESNTSESCNSNSSGSNYPATDGSGFNFMQPGGNSHVIAGPDGELYSTPTSMSNQETVADLQGNSITLGSDGWHDTAGRVIPGSYTGPGTANGTASSWPITGLDPIPGVPTAVANTTCPGGTQAARVWTVPSFSASGSGAANYYLCYSPVSYNTAFNVGATTGDTHYPAASIQEASGTTPPLLTAIMLPDGTSYRFGYDQYLSLNYLGLPTGGSISYTWQTVPFIGSPSTPVSRALKSRTLNPGNGQPSQTWNYHFNIALTDNGTGAKQVGYPAWGVVTDPAGNDVEHELGGGTDQAGIPIVGLSEEQRVTYSGCGPHDTTADRSCSGAGTALQTDQYTLQGWGGRSGTGEISPAYRVVATQTTVPSSGGSLVRKTVVTPVPNYGTCTLPNVSTGQGGYNPSPYQSCYTTGQTASVATYGWGAPGSGAPGPLLNTTTTNYQWQAAPTYLSANLINPVKSTVTTDGSGATAAETDYGYDEGNGSPAGVLGNQTSATTVLAGGASPKTQTVYNGQGQPTSVADARNNATSISYQCSGSLPLAMTNALSQATQFSYDCGSGLLASVTDPNGKASRYSYDALGRRTDIFGPSSAQNGGAQAHTSYVYTPASGSTPATITATDPIGLTMKTMYDGLGRTIHAQVTSDPSGTDTVDTNYDALGRVASVSTPYRSTSDPTYGITKYSYDALGRTVSQTDPADAQAGTGTQSWSYDGATVTYTNENSFLWKRTYDALGHLTQVLEPGTSSPNAAPTLESDYTYDALGNLTCVEQHGGVSGTGCSAPASSDASSQWRVRRFAYDSLSRLTAAKNPESGTASYSYDANGNVQSKTDARGVVTTYTWDALNRLSAKSYANDPSNTPAASFNYDTPKQGWSLPSQTYPSATPSAALNQIGQSNLAGRLSWAANGSSTEVYGYDEAGRTTLKSVCTPST